jgi:hypothetical protein
VIRRVIGLLLVVLTAGALVGVARNVPAEAVRQRTGAALPVTPAAEVPVCSGPETLQAPDGAVAVPAPGPVTLAGVVASSTALGRRTGLDTPPASGDRGGGEPAVPPAALDPIGDRGRQLAAAGPSPSTTGTTGGPGRTASAGSAARVVGASPTQAGAWRLDTGRTGEVPVVAAAQWTLATAGDLRGLVATTCEPAGSDSWLVGGGTQPGRRARLLLANPGVSPAVVDVTLHGPQGVVQAPAGNGVTVAPGRQKALYLDALAPGIPALAVHVQARSGRVAATLHDAVLRGLVPGGADDVPAAAPPARRQVVPGISVAAPVAPSGSQTGSLAVAPTAPGAVAVRVVDPAGTEAVVRVHLLGPGGEVNLPGGGVAVVPARGVADVVVAEVPDGVYAAVVEADLPVVAAALVGRSRAGSELAGTPAAARGGAAPSELAWSAGGRALQATTAVALPTASVPSRPGVGGPVVSARLSLAPLTAGTGGRVVLAEVAADGSVGAARTVEVPADRCVIVDVATGVAGVLLRPDVSAGQVVAALVLSGADAGGGLISVQAVRPGSRITGDAPTAVQDLRVGLRPPARKP